MTCPFCDAEQPELISQFGSQLLLAQYRCRACGTYFEGLRNFPGGDPPGAVPDSRGVPHDGSPGRAEVAKRATGLPPARVPMSAERAQRADTENPDR
jgi:hypothetical protein